MKRAIIFLFWSFTLVHGQWKKNDTSRKRINEEALKPEWHRIELPLDHFDVLDNRTYWARYITNDQFYKKGGPIVVYIGGEWEIADYGVMGGVAFQLARKYNGYLFYPEHRYFGKSLPFPMPVSTENLRYITPDYSLADLAYTITNLKKTVAGLENAQVVVAGGSYAGALAIWARLKYPHLINIAYNCGGVIKAETFNKGYSEVNYRSYNEVNPKCQDLIIAGVEEAKKMHKTKKGAAKLDAMFPDLSCHKIDTLFEFHGRIHNAFNPQVWPVYKALEVCHYLMTNTTGSPVERLSQAINWTSDGTARDCAPENDREWFYLVCTFIGNMQVSGKSNYGNLYTSEERIRKSCIRNFGPRFNKDFVDQHTRRTTILNGDNTPDVTKVLSVQGTYDPWRTNSILDDLNDETPVIYIKEATHCLELGEEQDDETPQVAQSKLDILEVLSRWII